MSTAIRRVSVIITCFNLQQYVGQAIESVLRQAPCDAEVEVIVVDDASTDASREVVRRYPQVRLVESPTNGGVLEATLLGLKAASGDVISFLDADDVWHATKLKRVVDRFRSDPRVTIVSHDYRYVDASGQVVRRPDTTQRPLYEAPDADAVHARMREGLLRIEGRVWLGSAYAVRHDPAQLAGFFAFCDALPERRFTYQDFPLAFWWATAPKARFGYVPEVLFDYRLHGGNASGAVASVDKMLANVRKGRNTRRALVAIIRQRDPEAEQYLPRLELLVREYDYLDALYRGRSAEAARLFVTLGRATWTPAHAAKEALRLSAIALLSPTGATSALMRLRKLRPMR